MRQYLLLGLATLISCEPTMLEVESSQQFGECYEGCRIAFGEVLSYRDFNGTVEEYSLAWDLCIDLCEEGRLR